MATSPAPLFQLHITQDVDVPVLHHDATGFTTLRAAQHYAQAWADRCPGEGSLSWVRERFDYVASGATFDYLIEEC